MSKLLKNVLYTVELVEQVSLQPAIPASLLAVLWYGPAPFRDWFLKLLAEHTTIQPQMLRLTLRVLLALGSIKLANRSLSKVAANNWLVSSPKPWQWSKEIAVVTGGSGGIGRLIVQGLAKRGLTVVVLDVQELPKELMGNVCIRYLQCDLSSTSSISHAADTVKRNIGHPSILINNAGIAPAHYILDTPDEYLQKIFRVNLLSHWATTREFLPSMISQNKGHIVTVASMASFATLATSVDYSATKAGALAFHEGLSCELRQVYKAPGVITTVVLPTYVQTPMTDIAEYLYVRERGLISAEEVANTIVKQILSGQGGQLTFPSYLSLVVSSLRAWPTWLQELFRDTLSRPVIAGTEASKR